MQQYTKRLISEHTLINAALIIIAMGFFLIMFPFNGRYSVQGLYALAALGGDISIALLSLAAQWRIVIPGSVVPLPIIPWSIVAANSAIQVYITYKTLMRRTLSIGVIVLGALLSAYDAITTFLGLNSVDWAQRYLLVHILITAIITFSFEMITALIITYWRKG